MARLTQGRSCRVADSLRYSLVPPSLLPQLSALSRITAPLYEVLSENNQRSLFRTLCRVLQSTRDAAQPGTADLVGPVVLDTLSRLPISVQLVQELVVLPDSGDAKSRKRSRKDSQSADSLPEQLQLVNVALDILQLKHSIADIYKLVGSLFLLLNQLLDTNHPASHQPTTAYTIQVVLAALCAITDSFVVVEEPAAADEQRSNKRRKVTVSPAPHVASLLNKIKAEYDVKSIVRCIDGTSHPFSARSPSKHSFDDRRLNRCAVCRNPQTSNRALLLLASITNLFPQMVVDNIMPIFTFMGAATLRQDDNSSFHVIQKVRAQSHHRREYLV